MTLNNSSVKVSSLNIKDLLTDGDQYVIPMYQRNYAWGTVEIETLIKDIIDAYNRDQSLTYYLGTLVVFDKSNTSQALFEVIDGQQRLTTLTLLAVYLHHHHRQYCDSYLKSFNQPNLHFESRPHSAYTLSLLYNDDSARFTKDTSINQSIIDGYDILTKTMKHIFDGNNEVISINEFCTFLFDKIEIARVPVPQETDLNHYFEVMNNRGEQLEKHEIIKARLLSAISSDTSADTKQTQHCKSLLSLIWDTCSRMDKYVQYGFTTDLRKKVFSSDWAHFEPKDFSDLLKLYIRDCNEQAAKKSKDSSKTTSEVKAQNIISLNDILFKDDITIPANPAKKNKGEEDDETYYSLIDFPNFLLQVLRVHVTQNLTDNQNENQNEKPQNDIVSLDDKQLLIEFDNHLIGSKVSNKVTKIEHFLYTLLKTKFLFDQYIIKRNTESKKGYWTLEQLINEASGPSYKQNMPKGSTGPDLNASLVTLQSAFHVSAPTLNSKYWLNACLQYLYLMFVKREQGIDGKQFLSYLDGLARAYMLRRYIAQSDRTKPNNIVNDYFQEFRQHINDNSETTLSSPSLSPRTIELEKLSQQLRYPHVNIFVFNYLDYLIWLKGNIKSDDKKKFRPSTQGSIEHFIPQTPIHKDEKVDDRRYIHRFGNLCLINRGLNSRVSNHKPLAKKEHYDESFKNHIDSLKLYKMIETLEQHNDEWNIDAITEHETEMFSLLEDALDIKIRDNNNE
ncbi:DUF262 domain-containing HNH endonuclease family protein [Psychrobacter sp. FBL11]|uniref:DUF262 domain-containing HNH endonuclease family protein n=1 Tax=Psychrobacter saeujeotis TaxID=3143436 RepID=A0ABU9X7Q4_9GAMM|nr:DUF262 domain-containing HNH endonuclease family protein [uncultured Psychrobacter sp.]